MTSVPSSRRQNHKMFADESDEVCRLCYHLSSTFTEEVGRITASDQTVRAVHSCISCFFFIYIFRLDESLRNCIMTTFNEDVFDV